MWLHMAINLQKENSHKRDYFLWQPINIKAISLLTGSHSIQLGVTAEFIHFNINFKNKLIEKK